MIRCSVPVLWSQKRYQTVFLRLKRPVQWRLCILVFNSYYRMLVEFKRGMGG